MKMPDTETKPNPKNTQLYNKHTHTYAFLSVDINLNKMLPQTTPDNIWMKVYWMINTRS